MTGELYAALTQSFMGRLAEEPDDDGAGAPVAQAMAGLPGGLMRTIFQARAQVLGGAMSGHAVRPYLSRLLIETEALGAQAMFGAGRPVYLVAGAPHVDPYAAALAGCGFSTTIYDPETTTVAGLVRLAAAAGLRQPSLD